MISFFLVTLVLASYKVAGGHNRRASWKQYGHGYGHGHGHHFDIDSNHPVFHHVEGRNSRVWGKDFDNNDPDEYDTNSFWDDLDDWDNFDEDKNWENYGDERMSKVSNRRKDIYCTYNTESICSGIGKRFRELPGCRKFVDCNHPEKAIYICGRRQIFHQKTQLCQNINRNIKCRCYIDTTTQQTVTTPTTSTLTTTLTTLSVTTPIQTTTTTTQQPMTTATTKLTTTTLAPMSTKALSTSQKIIIGTTKPKP
ncbi:uncharacterized protein LOC135928585 [Gordionus sp. m RMFG-2023]|uniref:uncharacterized protein LOC135928585 n=1 Tax=Gordionus sp. m RMFG-2023 TaxID=3053472 RepID=UPI0031FC7C43